MFVCACKGREWGGEGGGCFHEISVGAMHPLTHTSPHPPTHPLTLETYTPQKPPAQWHRKGGAEYKGKGVWRGGGGVSATGVHIIFSFIESL